MVIRFDGVRVDNRVVPGTRIICREDAMVNRAVRHLRTGEQH
jgi:hypothetical protein